MSHHLQQSNNGGELSAVELVEQMVSGCL